MREYKDKNGKVIKAGMTIKHNSGKIEKIFSNIDEDDLGINASNLEFLKRHPSMPQEIYPLSTLGLAEWEIVEE